MTRRRKLALVAGAALAALWLLATDLGLVYAAWRLLP